MDDAKRIRTSGDRAIIARVMAMQRQTRGLIIALFAVGLFHMAFLRRWPAVFVDEAWMASRAWGWLTTGLNFGPLDAGVHDKLEGYWTFFPLLPTLLHAATIQVAGLSVTSLRALSLLFGIGLAFAAYSVSLQLSGSRRCGLISSLLVSTSLSFMYSSHIVRPDIFVAALGLSAIALQLAARQKQRVAVNFLAGLLVALAFEIHVNAVIYGVVIVALSAADHGWRFLRRQSFWGLVAGAGLGLAGYAWLHVLPYPGTYFLMGGRLAETHFPPLLALRVSSMLTLLPRTGGLLLKMTGLRFFAAPIASAVLWRRPSTGTRTSLVMFVTGVLADAMLVRNKCGYYAILVSPFSDIVLAMWIEGTLDGHLASSFWLKRGKALGYSLIMLSMAVALALAILHPPPGELERVAARIVQVIPEGGSVMGPQTYWFGLVQHPYMNWQQMRIYQRFNPGSSVQDAMQALKPDVLVVDDHMRHFIVADQSYPPRSGAERFIWERHVPKDQFDAFLACRGQLVESVETEAYGSVEIYSVHWDDVDVACP